MRRRLMPEHVDWDRFLPGAGVGWLALPHDLGGESIRPNRVNSRVRAPD